MTDYGIMLTISTDNLERCFGTGQTGGNGREHALR
jgi:hypothetical protein